MREDLQAVLRDAIEWGYDAQPSGEDVVQVRLHFGANLEFAALRDGDLLVGFDDTAWHMHPDRGSDGTPTQTASELLAEFAVGDWLVVSRFSSGKLTDRWLERRTGAIELEYLSPGEELTVHFATSQAQRDEPDA